MAVVVALSGCIPVANLSARISESGLIEFAVCDDYDLDSIKVSILDKESHDSRTVWQIEGQIEIEDGDIVRLGKQPAGSEVIVELGDFDISQSYVDFILISHPDGQIVSSYGHFDGAELVEDRWLQTSGGYRDNAC